MKKTLKFENMKFFLKKMGKTISFLEVRSLSPTCASPVARKKSGFLLPSASTIGGSGFARRRRRRVGGSFVNAKLGKVQYHVLLLLYLIRGGFKGGNKGTKEQIPSSTAFPCFSPNSPASLDQLGFPKGKGGKIPFTSFPFPFGGPRGGGDT